MPAVPQSEGHARLIELVGRSSLAKVGTPLGVSKQAVARIVQSGRASPEVRQGLEAHFQIPVRAWDVQPGVSLDAPTGQRPEPASAPSGRPSDPADEDPDDPGTALDGLRAHVRKCIQRRKAAEGSGSSGLALRDLVAAELRALAKWGQATGEMSPGDEARLTTSSRYLRIQGAIVRALVPFPDAAAAVLKALAEVEPEAARLLEQQSWPA